MFFLGCHVPAEDKVLFSVDFGTVKPAVLEPLSHYRWSAETKAKAASYSGVDIRTEREGGSAALHIRIAPDFPWSDDHFIIYRTSYDYLPPECDAIRLRAKALEGKFEVCFGSPTVYFGCSDVKTVSRKIEATESGDYQTYEFSLNKGLSRNFRRAGRTKDLPFVQYTRWIQEPVFLYMAKGAGGEIAISAIEFVAKGEGRPYAAADVEDAGKPVARADFSAASAAGKIFTCSLQDILSVDGPPPTVRERLKDGRIVVEYGGGKTQIMHPPPEISLKEENGKKCLSVKKRFCEEIVFGGVKVDGAPGANAIEIRLRASQESKKAKEIVVDVLLVTSSKGSAKFDWGEFVPSAAWRGIPELDFNCYLGGRPPGKQDFALFHCRRAVKPDEWTRLLLPLSDFLCCYGQGDISGKHFKEQSAPAAGEMVAIGFLVSFRHNYTTTELLVGEVMARCVAQTVDHPSFVQNKGD